MSGSLKLNPANYSTVWSDNFGSDNQLNSSLFPVRWGNADDFNFSNGALNLTSYASENWTNVGFLQPDFGATSAQGYGLYSVLASANAGEANGIAITMWPSDNNWPGPEIDLLEDWSDPTRQTGYATIHWKGSDGSNQYDPHQFTLDLTKPHTFAMDWEPGSLTYYIDGTQLFQVTGSPEVPKDATDGGVNESFGAEVTAAGSGAISSSVSLHLHSMSYAQFVGSSSPPPPTPSPTIAVSNPGTVQGRGGAGVNVPITISDPGLTTVYARVLNAKGVAEENWIKIPLTTSGSRTHTFHFQHTGDYVVAVNDPATQVDRGQSAPITITSRNVNGNTASFVSSESATTRVAGITATTPELGPNTPAISPDQHGITYTIAHVEGAEVIKNFNLLLGDKLVLAQSLRNEVQTLTGSNGSTLTFGDPTHRIDLPGAQIGSNDLLTSPPA